MLDRIDPTRYNQFRSAYHRQALAAMEPLRKALGYEPRIEVLPDRQHVSVAAAATWDHRVTVRPGSYLWALSGSTTQPEGFTVQLTDAATRSNMFSGALQLQNITGQGTASVKDCGGTSRTIKTPLHVLAVPRPLVEPGLLNVQIVNKSSSANAIQLVLWIWEPPQLATEWNEWNQELALEIAAWRQLVGALPHVAAGAGGTPSSSSSNGKSYLNDPAMLSPAYHRAYNVQDAGDNIIIPSVPGRRIAIHQMSLYNLVEQDIRVLDGTVDLTGPFSDFGEGGALYLPYQEEPHFVLQDGNPFVINLSAIASVGTTGGVTGFVKYRLFSSWTPGGQA